MNRGVRAKKNVNYVDSSGDDKDDSDFDENGFEDDEDGESDPATADVSCDGASAFALQCVNDAITIRLYKLFNTLDER